MKKPEGKMDKIIDMVLKNGSIDANGNRYIKSECKRDHRLFAVVLSKPLSSLGDNTVEWETAYEIHSDPIYDQETFEDMIWDYCSDHIDDDDFGGQFPEVDRETIEYNEINNQWIANCKFPTDDNWYSLVGYPDGNIELYY